MIPAILGKKIGMTQVFEPSGERVPVTIIQAGPCYVLQVKRADSKDGYDSVQLGFDDVKPHRSNLAQIGHARKASTLPKRFIREIRLTEATDKNVGDTVTVDILKDVKWVDVTGVTKGKGTQGVMRRWGFGGQPASHGTERKHRSPGSIGSRAAMRGQSGAIKRGLRMAGHMGHKRRTARCQALVAVDAENNVLLIRGSVPGPEGGYVLVRRSKTRS
ncbi:MAG: 50S ribosomal protein L3 [Phycisphaerae bacterium]|nr:50S ribosomal protein L3 [Phycisphaerae bacterium]MCZ2401330.1 50S ribosomal protein L3 [Phycisphaerae bacterium]NUQ48698.1 50S ribosomal protein L3 [Phycisphaerae bacterium]